MAAHLILIKHAMPVLDAERPAREWRLGSAGEGQARELARDLRARLPFTLVSSEEPKASRTAEIIAAELGIGCRSAAGLEEIDRPALPVVDAAEHERVNWPIFDEPSRAALGRESADDALDRFSAALAGGLEDLDRDAGLVVITHGTVMALFAAAHSPVDPWKLWKRLACCDSLEFELPGFRLVGAASADEVIDLYENHADDWDAHRPRVLFERAWLDRFLALLPADASVLDLGCGAGEPIARYFIDNGHRVCGVDTSPQLVAKCTVRFPEHEWHVGDMRDLSMGKQFDSIVAWDSFFHLPSEDQRGMFEVFDRHAAAGAALLFTSGPEDGEVIGVLEGEPLYHASLCPEEYRELLKGIGFSVASHIGNDPDCEGHTVWLAQRR